LAERGHAVTVVDRSAQALELLKGRGNRDICAKHGDFLTMDFESVFDFVVAMESVQYFTAISLDRLFARIRLLLRPGGRFVFTQLNRGSWRYALHAVRGSRHPPYNVDTAAGYRAALRQAGFEVLEMEGFCWMPFTASSNSSLVPLFASIEGALKLNHWPGQSPWLLVAAENPHR
jgi:SAM-dependent methyltransferase